MSFRNSPFNPNSGVATTSSLGSTGDPPVPTGDPPIGTGGRVRTFPGGWFHGQAPLRSLGPVSQRDGQAARATHPISEFGFSAQTARDALGLTTALLTIFALCGNATAAFYLNCAGCHMEPQNGMAIVNFQATTNLGHGLRKIFQVSPGQTAVIQFNVTNNYAGNYALSLNHLDARGVRNRNHHLSYTADPNWSSHFPGTATNFFMAGCATKSPNLWTFNLVVQTNTPADFYPVNSQLGGYYSTNLWSQQETFYVQVVAAAPPVPVNQAPHGSGNESVKP